MDILCRKGTVIVKLSKADRNALNLLISNCRDLGKRADDEKAGELVEALEALRDRYPEPVKVK